MTNKITMNPDQRLFVIPSGDGYSCFGFDNCFRHAQQLATLLQRPELAPREDEIGQLKQYEQYRELIRLAGSADLGTYFDPGTRPEVREVLERYRHTGQKIRLFLGDDVTGRDWLEQHDVLGTVGRSMGPLKVLLLTGRDRISGPAILTACIVRMMDVKTGITLYRHPTYNIADFDIVRWSKGKYLAEVRTGGSCHARFTSLVKAQRWLAFIKGESMTQP